MEKIEFSYDKKSDDLLLYRQNTKSHGSVEYGDIVLDFNRKKELVGLQFLKATETIQDITNEKNIPKILAELLNCEMEVKQKGNMLLIKIGLFSETGQIHSVINVPFLTRTSLALMTA